MPERPFRTPIALSVALAMVAFGLITLRSEVSYLDGPPLNHYGFPFAYLRWGQVSSLEYDVRWWALLIDFLVYWLACYALLALLRRFDPLPGLSALARRWLIRTLYTVAALQLVLAASMLTSGMYQFHAWPEVEQRSVTHHLHVGWATPY